MQEENLTAATSTEVSVQDYFDARMHTMGITPEINSIHIAQYDAEKKENITVPMPVFSAGKKGIDILVYRLDRTLIMYGKNGSRWKTEPFKITRLANPKGNQKYDIPKGVGTYPFIPPQLITKYENKEPIETLILTEGYFKAFKAAMHGFDIIGLSSITHYKEKDTNSIHSDIQSLIRTCKVKRVVWLVDGDCLDLSSKIFDKEDQADAYKRPNQFFSSVKAVRQLLLDHVDEIYFAHLNSDAHEEKPKALDDLLVCMKGKEELVVNDFAVFSKPNHFFSKMDISVGTSKVHAYFHLRGVDDFFQFYHERYPKLAEKDFIYNGTKYRYDAEKNQCVIMVPADAKRFFRVGDQYHEKVVIPNKYGSLDNTFHRRMKTTIIDDHGKDLLAHVPKYKAFCVVPDHTNYQEVIHSCFNLYAPFEHEPKEDDCPVTIEFLKHIFGNGTVSFTHPESKERITVNELDLGLDYMQLLFQKPTQTLPILCLVSRENATGKSTFAKWLRLIFTQNVAIVGNAELADNFNASWASKLLVICDEAKIDKQVVVEKVKSLSTADKIFMNAKGKDHVEIDFFAKFIFLTNNEDNFIYASDEDVRYWIRKVSRITSTNVDILKDLKDEIPSFLHMLNKRKIVTENLTRAWFHSDLIKTEALKKVVASSQSTLVKEIRQQIRDMFFDFPDLMQIEMTKRAVKEEFFRGKNYEMNYITNVLEEQLKISMAFIYKYNGETFKTAEELLLKNPDVNVEKCKSSLVKRHSYPRWEFNSHAAQLTKERVIVNDIGRPYLFNISQFLSQDEIMHREDINSENDKTESANITFPLSF
jgi:hypothetical protein